MLLDVNGVGNESAGSEDLTRAFAKRPPRIDWSITLEAEDGTSLQAFSVAGESYQLIALTDEGRFDGRTPLEAKSAEAVLRRFLAGDRSWREALSAVESTGPERHWRLGEVLGASDRPSDIHPSRPNRPTGRLSRKEAVGCLGIVVVLGAISYWAVMQGPATVARLFPQAENPRLVLLTGVMGFFALLFGIASGAVALRARRWPAVTGDVTASTIVESSDSIGGGGGATHRRLYRPAVVYRYRVDGQSFDATQITLGTEWKGSEAAARAVVARYPVGAQVTVRYDPADPGAAYLRYSVWSPVLGLALAAGLLAFSAHLAGLF